MKQDELFKTDYATRAKELFKELEALAEHIKPTLVTSPDQVIDYFRASNIKQKKERLIVFFMNSKNRVMDVETVCEGTIDQVVIYPREIVKKCLEKDATSIIMAHNHPSGECDPSGADIRLTEAVKKACEALEIKLLDHMITGNKTADYFSFLEEGLL